MKKPEKKRKEEEEEEEFETPMKFKVIVERENR